MNATKTAGRFKVSEHWSSRTERMVYSVQAPDDPETLSLVYLRTASGARRTWSKRSSAQAAADAANAQPEEEETEDVQDTEPEDYYLCIHCGAELDYNDQACEDCADEDDNCDQDEG